jgi:hypothetical protein
VTLATWRRAVLLPFVVSRLALFLVGLAGFGLIGSVRDRMPGNLIAHAPAAAPLEIWARWDAEWYLLIAEQGYRNDEKLAGYSSDYHSEDAAGFFPLYPLLIRAGSAVGLAPIASGLLVSHLALLAALTLLHRETRERFGEPAADAAVWLLLAFPPSLFLSAVYGESLALALTLAAFRLARGSKWGALAACGFLCALARPTGLLVGVALAWEVWERKGGWRGWLSLLGFPAGTAAFSYFCGQTFGDPLAWAHRQERWRGALSGPWRALIRYFQAGPQIHGAHNSTLELIFALLFLSALPFLFRAVPRSWSTHALLSVLVPLGSTLWSFGRLSLVAFPVFAWAGERAAKHRQGVPILLALGLPVGGMLMLLFACGWWAG